jgi:hypothetical protein
MWWLVGLQKAVQPLVAQIPMLKFGRILSGQNLKRAERADQRLVSRMQMLQNWLVHQMLMELRRSQMLW